ncbi:hypothetical protein LCGC14_2018270, partial [marine sediment metagenome]
DYNQAITDIQARSAATTAEATRRIGTTKEEGVLSLKEQGAQAAFEGRMAMTQAEMVASSEEAKLGASGVRAKGSPLAAAQQNVDLAFAAADRTIERGSAGMAMGTITFSGDKSLREIFDEFALQDNFIWSLNPVGVMTYNNGTTDSLILLNASSPIYNVNKTFGERALNYINIKGGFVGGAQVVGTPAQNIPGQQTNGRLPFEQTFSHLDLPAQCTTTNTNILSRLGTQPLIVPFTHKDSLIGVIQVGELVTFEYDLTDPNISRFQGLILDCIYDAKQGKGNYRISDIVI